MKVENANISWLESGLPYSTEFQDIYYSAVDALAESEHVFLAANNLRERWRTASEADRFRIGELGFGCGLNFLQTCKLWLASDFRPRRLHYIAFEKHPLRREQLRQVLQCWPTLESLSELLLSRYTDHGAGCHRILLTDSITLDLYLGDAGEQLERRMAESCPAIHCWYLDGFSPARNDELWRASLMELIAASSGPGTTLSSYSVAGKVRNAIAEAGFEVKKIEGFAAKRHSLFAVKTQSNATTPPAAGATPWLVLPETRFAGNSAAIVGAGLAGCSTAYSLARRGWQVTLFDAGAGPAAGASGIARLALRCRLFNTVSAEAEFFLQAYLCAVRQFTELEDIDWQRCGVLQLVDAMNRRSPFREETLQELYSQQVVELLDREQASLRAGLTLRDAAWYFPEAGSIDPASLCRRYLAHPNIRSQFGTPITSLSRQGSGWRLESKGSQVAVADAVVIANSHNASAFSQCESLPLQVSRGQSTEIKSESNGEALKCVVSGERTVFPVSAERHIISASYSDSSDLDTWSADRQENMRLANKIFTTDKALSGEAVLDRVALRCNTADRFPLVGMLPDFERMRESYGELARNAKAQFAENGAYHNGLYLNVAHGSNGLSSCPLSAEFLASLITGENLPLSRDTIRQLNPVRFLISDLKKQRA